MHIFPKKRWGALILSLALVIFTPLAFYWGAAGLREGTAGQSRQALEDSLRRAAVHCYAVEGRYPPSLTYLTTHYGVHVNRAQFTVYYQKVAANLMPDITVLDIASQDAGEAAP